MEICDTALDNKDATRRVHAELGVGFRSFKESYKSLVEMKQNEWVKVGFPYAMTHRNQLPRLTSSSCRGIGHRLAASAIQAPFQPMELRPSQRHVLLFEDQDRFPAPVLLLVAIVHCRCVRYLQGPVQQDDALFRGEGRAGVRIASIVTFILF